MSRISRVLVFLIIALLAVGLVPAFAQDATAEATAAPSQVTIEAGKDGINVPANVPAGIVAISFANNGDAPFSPVLARLNEGVTQDALTQALSQGPEAALPLLTLLGGTDVAPNSTFDITYDLKAGNYVLLNFASNSPDMKTFTVAGNGSATAPQTDVQVTLMDFAFSLPTTITAGPHTWGVENKGTQWHEMSIARLPDTMTVAEYRNLLMTAASNQSPESTPPPEVQQVFTWSPIQQGERAWFTLDLQPGTYVLVCFLPDFASGHAHADMGMEQIITVTE